MTKHTIIIVGASGYIGRPLFDKAKEKSTAYGTASKATDGLIGLQLDSPDDFDYELIKPSDTVLLAAAISAPDICAREHERAWSVNVTGTSEFINRVMKRGGRVIFFSSDTVYGEISDEFDEASPCDPSGEYAEMKREIEKQFLDNSLFKVIRLSYVFLRKINLQNIYRDVQNVVKKLRYFTHFIGL